MISVPPEAIAVYEFIERQYRLSGLFPSTREIMVGCNYASTSAVRHQVNRLARCGWLQVKGERAYNLLREPKIYYIREEMK